MKSLEELKVEYNDLCHAMQSGVKAKMDHIDPSDTTPKHLRTGVNSALVDSSALARLLMKKNIISEQEYYEAMVEGMREEVRRYELELSEFFGKKITLA